MARHEDPRSPSESWEDAEDEESEELLGASFFPPMQNRLLTGEILGNALRASDLRIALEALAKYANDPTVEFVNQDILPPGWDDAKEFIGVVLQSAMDKFYRMDVFLRMHQDYPEQLFACMYYLCYACTGFTAIVSESSAAFGDLHDQELCGLLSATYNMLDSRSAVYQLQCVRQLPNLETLIDRTENYLMAQPPGQVSCGESDDEVAEATDGVIHVHGAEGGNHWQAYLVQLLLGTGFVENAMKILTAPMLHTMQLHSSLLGLVSLLVQLLSNVVHQQLSQERRLAVERGIAGFLSWVADDVLADPEKLFSGRERASQWLSHALANCHEMMQELQLPNTQLTAVQRQVVTEMLKSSNFSRLLSAVQECRSLLSYSSRRSSQMLEGNTDPDVIGIEENVRWLDEERIVKQMLRVNLHQSQYVDAVLGILRVLAECGHFNDEHLDMLWGVTEQEDTFDAVKTNVCHMIKQLAQHLRPQQLDLLFSKFENRKGRTLPDTLRLLDLLRRLAQSDTKKASSMAGKLVELVWELTTPVDAPPELLDSSVMLDVLEGYKQHALLHEYIQRCIAQLRARTNVYTALTVLQNLLRLWGKLYGWEARSGPTREERRSGGPRPLCELLGALDRESSSVATPPLSRLLVDNLVDFMAAAARWLEERRVPHLSNGGFSSTGGAGGSAVPPTGMAGGGGGGGGGSVTQQPPGQGSYSYQQIVRRYLDVFRLVSQCKDTYVELRHVEALWDAVVLRPNTPEDMPSGLDLVLACAGEGDDDAQADAAGADGLVIPPGPLLEPRDLCKLLQDRVTRLPVDNLAQPAFACFKACLQAAQAGLEEHLRHLAAHAARSTRGELGEQETVRLIQTVRVLGQGYLWQIVLDCQRSEVTSSASDMLINEMYGRDGINDMISDTRTRLMEAAALLTAAPPCTQEWEHIELPVDVMESSRWELARTRATRCMQLLEQLAGKSEESMPPVPMHSASWQGPSLLLEVTTQEQGRIKIGCTANEYVGLLRRKVAQRLGVEPACVRLVVGGQELRTDGRTLQSAFPSTWSSRQTLLAQVSPRANRYTRFGEDWWAAWHSGSTLAHMYHDDQLYRVLLLLADLPKAPGVRAAASRLLQQLPTCSWVPAGLLEALHSDQPAAQLRGQLLGPGGGVERPGLLLYTLQALYALLQPSYPVDLLPLVSKPWPSTQPPHDGVSGGLDVAVAHPTAGQQPPAQHQRQQAAAASASQVWWQVVAAGGAAERLLPVLAKCVPLLAEVVNKVMAPVAGAAEAATAAAVAAASNPVPSPLLDVGRLAATQPAADLAFVKDFQWVMLFLLCNIYQRARRGPSLDNRPPFTCAVGEAAATAVARAQPADSLSSSHGQELQDGGTSSAAAPRPNQQPHTHPQQLQARDPRHDATAVPGGPQGCRAASGGQESEAQTQEATAGPLYGNGGGGIAATPEVTSADAETCTSTQRTQECGDSAHLQPACASGSAAVAALVSGLVVSSHGSPDAAAEAGRDPAASSYMDISVGGAAAPAPRSHTNVASQPLPLPSPLPPLEATSLSAQVPVFGSSTDVEMAAASGSHVDAVQQLLSASSSQQHAPGAPSQAFSVSIAGPSVTAAGAAAGAAPGVIQSAGGGVPVAGDGHANLLHYLGAEGMRCLVSLLVRMAYDAGCLWGYGRLMVAQQQGGPGAGRSLLGVGAVAAAAVAPSYQQMCAAADVACRLASKALQVLSRLVHWPDLRNAFFADPSAVPMLLETLSCEFSPAIRDCALNHLEGVFAGGLQLQLPPQHYIWVLKSLVSLRPAMEYRLESCLEFHVLLAKVLHQLPELASPSAEARLLADSVLSEEVARLDVGAEELMQPKRALLLRGKLMLVRELVRALERLGLGLGANGRPGLISILLNRYLFPEAQPLWQPDASHSIMEAALQHVAADAGVRREALQLVQFLMTACPSNLEQGFRDLSRLHYDNGLRTIDRKFDIGGEGVKSEGSYVGLRNGGATCYMNSVLQQLFMQPRIRELVLQAGAVDLEEQQDSVFHQLQVMFAHLRLGRASCYHPRSFWQSFKDYDGQPIDVREHQDAYEFFTRLQDSVDSYLRATGQTPAMQAVMGGKFAAQIICKDVNYRSEREEEFYQISVEVAGFNSLEKSLEGYVAGELMEGDNSYYCEELGARVAAVRRTVIKELPHTLVIHLKRFEYDHLNMTRYKLRDRFEFPVVLDMFKYTADGLAALEGTGSPSATTAQGSDGASGRAVGPSSGGAGADAGARPRNCYLYELKGIVVHSGTAFAGHYYSFIKERPKLGEDQQVTEGSWYRFDDKAVIPWNIQDLEADCFGGRPASSTGGGGRADAERPYSAYMLFYEHRDSPSYDRPEADMCAVPRDVVIAAAATPTATPTPTHAPAAVATGGDPREGVTGMGPEQRAAALRGIGDGAERMGRADDMETDGPSEKQQGEQLRVGPMRPAEPTVITTPYGIPVLLYQNVLRENLQLMHKLHVLNKEYFAFVRQVVEVTWETVLAGRKTRRRDLHHHSHPHQLPGGNTGSASSLSPGGAATNGTATAATGAAASGGAGTAASGGAESSSAPSQRNEELDETVLLSARLATAFLLNVYLPAPPALRSDMAAWRDMLRHMLQASPRACVELLRLVTESPPLQNFYFVRSGQDGLWLVEMLTFALQAAGRAAAATAAANSPGGCATSAGAFPDDLGTSTSAQPPQPSVPQFLQQQQLQNVAVALTNVLCKLAFGVLHDQQRSDPQHLPLCRALAALVSADPNCAWCVLSRHLTDAFALPSFLLSELGASADPDMLPDLSASLLLLHALMQYCSHSVQPQLYGGGSPPGIVRIPVAGGGGGGGGGSHAALYDLTGQLEELVEEGAVFEAALAHTGLLHQLHVAELLQFLMAGNGSTSVRFLNALMGRLCEAEQAGGPILEMLDALPSVLDVPDGLRPNRFYVLIFGHGQGPRPSLQRLAAQALQRQQGLNWLGMVAAAALATVWSGSEAAHNAVRNASPQTLSPLVSSLVGLVRQLNEFAAGQAERSAAAAAAAGGGGSQGGATAAARDTTAQAAALAQRARRAAGQLNSMLQVCVALIQPAPQPRAQEREHGSAQVVQQAHPHPQMQHRHPKHQQQQQKQVVHMAVAAQADEDENSTHGPVRIEEVETVEDRGGHGRVFEVHPAEGEGERGRLRAQVRVQPAPQQPVGVPGPDEEDEGHGEGDVGTDGEGGFDSDIPGDEADTAVGADKGGKAAEEGVAE